MEKRNKFSLCIKPTLKIIWNKLPEAKTRVKSKKITN